METQEQKIEKDKYDLAIEWLLKLDPEKFRAEVKKAWSLSGTPADCLFQFVSPSEEWTKRQINHNNLGCLTSIRSRDTFSGYLFEGCTPEITEAIRSDSRLPNRPDGISPENLSVFAEWQRKIDAEIRIPYEKGELTIPNFNPTYIGPVRMSVASK